ncbi:MAG: hypothetical protein CWE10_18845, partial [Symbiobacterium thermophilum]|nr:hypothetical protein [Symbiobacterium thermophilum]
MKWKQWTAGALALLMTVCSAPVAWSADWITKGGSPHRMSVVTDSQGLFELTPYWETQPLGESAVQPAVIDGVVYHLSGDYLWYLDLDKIHPPQVQATAVYDPAVGLPVPFNRAPGGSFIAPQSSPSYSPETGILYFGTGYGWLWAYHTRERWYQPARLELGCPIVGSPLVIHDQGRDIVVVADRPNYPGEESRPEGRPLCARTHGKIWVVQGLDDPAGTPRTISYEASTSKSDESGFGGFITPSAVMAPPHGNNPSFVIGTDGFEGGRALRLALDRDNDYRPYRVWTVDSTAG